MLTMKAKYALRAMSELARSERTLLQAHELAARCRAPGKFLETILVELRGAGFVESRRGQRGGHMLARPSEEISIGDLIRAIDGPLAPVRCARTATAASRWRAASPPTNPVATAPTPMPARCGR